MNYPLPNWIQPADPTANMLAGIRQGASIGEAQAQQAQFQQQLAARQQEQQERLRAEALRTQAEMETQKAYRQAQQALAQDRIKEEAKRAEETARHNLAMEGYYRGKSTAADEVAAAKMANQVRFTEELKNNGGDVAKALIAVPGFLSPTTIPLLRGTVGPKDLTPAAAANLLSKFPDVEYAIGDRKKASALKERALDALIGSAPKPPAPAPIQPQGMSPAMPAPGIPVPPMAPTAPAKGRYKYQILDEPAPAPADTSPDDSEE